MKRRRIDRERFKRANVCVTGGDIGEKGKSFPSLISELKDLQ